MINDKNPYDTLVGPGKPCMYCGKDYGRHTSTCPIFIRQLEQAREIREAEKTILAIAEGKYPIAEGYEVQHLAHQLAIILRLK